MQLGRQRQAGRCPSGNPCRHRGRTRTSGTGNSGKGTCATRTHRSRALCRLLCDTISIGQSRELCNPIRTDGELGRELTEAWCKRSRAGLQGAGHTGSTGRTSRLMEACEHRAQSLKKERKGKEREHDNREHNRRSSGRQRSQRDGLDINPKSATFHLSGSVSSSLKWRWNYPQLRWPPRGLQKTEHGEC